LARAKEADGVKNVDRRQFIKTAALAAGTFLGAGTFADCPSAANEPPSPSDLIPLGKTGIRVSRLAFGTGTVGYSKHSHQTRLGQQKFTELIRHAFDRGIRSFDLADQYGSHPFLAQAMKDGIPREKIVISTKIWTPLSQEEGVQGTLDRFRKELESDYIDILLLHCVMDDDWPKKLRNWMDGLEEAKQKKIIRAHGVSCHALGALKTAARTEWVDYIQARINHVGTRMDAAPKVVAPVLKQAHEAGRAIGGMKILGEGDIAEQREESLEFVLGLGCVDTLVIGFETPEEIDDISGKMSTILQKQAS
jgi:predicted aldo/keto reductase-like oxidoreductase